MKHHSGKNGKVHMLTIGFSVLLLAQTVLVGCAASARPTQETAPEPITFTFYNEIGSEDPWTDPVARAITEATGVTLETLYPSSGGADNIELMIATAEYPDLIFSREDAGLLIDRGALTDLAPLIEAYGPHIRELYGEDYERLRSDSGAVYILSADPVQNGTEGTSGSFQMQWAVLKYFDYRIPQSVDACTRMLRKYMGLHQKINGYPTIGITISCSDWHWYNTLSDPSGSIGCGSEGDGQWIVGEDGTVTYKHLAQGQKEFFFWLNQMYREGILDPEFATQSHEEYLKKISTGQVLALMDQRWDYEGAEKALVAAGQLQHTYACLPVTMEEGMVCRSLQPQPIASGWGIGITKACKDPVRAVQFLDWLCSEEGQIMLHWGLEEVNYEKTEEGVRYRTPEEISASLSDANYAAATGVGMHVFPFPTYGSRALDAEGQPIAVPGEKNASLYYNLQQKEALEQWKVSHLTDIFPQPEDLPAKTYTPLYARILPAELGKKKKELDAIARDGLIDCIVCPEEEFEARWEALQKALLDAGAEEAGAQMTELLRQELGR